MNNTPTKARQKMDNEKAIKILRKGYPDIKRYATIELAAYEYDVKAYNEALDRAIKALEEKPQNGGEKMCKEKPMKGQLNLFDQVPKSEACSYRFQRYIGQPVENHLYVELLSR